MYSVCWCQCRCICDACDLKGVLYKLTLKYCSRLLELTSIHTHTHIIHCLLIAFFFQPTLISFGKNKSAHTHTHKYTTSSVQTNIVFVAFILYILRTPCTVDAKCFLAYKYILTRVFGINLYIFPTWKPKIRLICALTAINEVACVCKFSVEFVYVCGAYAWNGIDKFF